MTVNKLDRCFLELMYDGEEAYLNFRRVIETANVIMATYADELLGDTQVCPGTSGFESICLLYIRSLLKMACRVCLTRITFPAAPKE